MLKLLRRHIGRTVIVWGPEDLVARGVLVAATDAGVALEHAEQVRTNAEPVPMDGDVVIPAHAITLVQVP